ncbi:MAG TPA: Ig-like domain-containing protein [Gemmatimonadaceae bacterium]|nr:Ig-like domain-containing protein [Gemmatimonadaceae bacterium]
MRARNPAFISLCVSLLAISAACSDTVGPNQDVLQPALPVAVKTVALTPTEATLSTGGHVAITATPLGANGKPVKTTVTWSSSDPKVATVSDSGQVAAVAPGNAKITVVANGVSATAAVTVLAATSATPTDSSTTPSTGSDASGLWTNEPAGFSALTNQSWNGGVSSLGWQEYDMYNHVTVESDASLPTGDGKALQFYYPAGFSGGGYGPGLVYYQMSKGEIYLGFYWKLSPNWQGHPSGVNKLLYVFQRQGQKRQAVFLVAHGSSGGPFHFEISNEASDGGKWWTQNVNNVSLVPGQWYKVELHMKKSSSDAAPNGLVEWWVNGKLAARYTNAKLRASNFSEVHVDPVWGGVDNSVKKSHSDYQRFGSIRISGR